VPLDENQEWSPTLSDSVPVSPLDRRAAGGEEAIPPSPIGSAAPSASTVASSKRKVIRKPSSLGQLSKGTSIKSQEGHDYVQEDVPVWFSRMGVMRPLSGALVLVKQANPPMRVTASLRKAESLALGQIAFFRLAANRISVAMVHDCVARAQRAGASGALFIVPGPSSFAVELILRHLPPGIGIEDPSGQEQAAAEGRPPMLGQGRPGEDKIIQMDFVIALCRNEEALTAGAWVEVNPNTSARRALLGDTASSVRIAGLQALAAISECNDERLVKALCEMVVDDDPHVRSIVTVSFQDRSLVMGGNPEAINGLAAQTLHPTPAVREAAMLALYRVADCTVETCDPRGIINSPVAIEALEARLTDPDGVVKKMAVDGLIHLAMSDGVIDEDDLPIIDTFVYSLDDQDPLVVSACAKALAFLSGEVDVKIVSAFSHMVDGRLDVRQGSARSLGLCRKGNVTALVALRRLLTDKDGAVRAEAATSLSQVSLGGDSQTLILITGLFLDPEAGPKIAALGCLTKVVGMTTGDMDALRGAIVGAVALLEDAGSAVRNHVSQAMAGVVEGSASDQVKEIVREAVFTMISSPLARARKEAMHALTMILEEGHSKIIEGVTSCFLDDSIEVQKYAFHIFGHHIKAHKAKGIALPANVKPSVLKCTTHEDPLVTSVSLEAIEAVCEQGDDEAVMACVHCLRDGSASVCETACRVVAHTAVRGDSRAVAAVTPLLISPMGYVRLAAITSLEKIGTIGDAKLLQAVMLRLSDKEVFVRREAVVGIQALAERGDPTAVGALVLGLEDADERIRGACIDGLALIGAKGDNVAIWALTNRFNTEARNLRRSAIKALGELVESNDPEAIESLLYALEDSDEGVKQAGVAAITHAVEKGDDFTIRRILATRCMSDDRKVRAVALQAVEAIALPGDHRVIEGMLVSIRDKGHPQLRKAGVETLMRFAAKKDPEVIKGLGDLLSESDADVRNAAVEGLLLCADKNSHAVMHSIASHLQSVEGNARTSALAALSKLCDPGDTSILQIFSKLLTHKESYVREAAVQAMRTVSKKCTCKIVETGCTCLGVRTLIPVMADASADVRKVVIEALVKLGNRADKRLLECARLALKDSSMPVRQAGEAGLRTFH